MAAVLTPCCSASYKLSGRICLLQMFAICKRRSKGSPDRLEVPSVGWLLRGLAALSAMGICAADVRCNAYASMTTRPLLVQVVSYGSAIQKGSAMLQGRCACCVLTWS